MTIGLLQTFVDLILAAGVIFLWVKLNRPQKDDPRLSRGLQLLQSKIAVLEDLSDQVETQVQQISVLLEAKGRELQNQVLSTDKQIQKIEAAMGKSLEVAKIFQDRIPHQEIIERQNTMKYVKAARLAHQGLSPEEIAQQVELSAGEIELITKVNKDQLQYSEEDLPEWAKDGHANEIQVPAPQNELHLNEQPLPRKEDVPISLSTLGDQFRQVLPKEDVLDLSSMGQEAPVLEMPQSFVKALNPAPVKELAQTTKGKEVEIQKVVFPRIDMNQHLS